MEDEVLDDLLQEIVGGAWSGLERAALRDLLVRLGGLVLDNPELVEVHLDAVDAMRTPASVVGSHLRIAPAPGAWDDEVRHLRRDPL
jgi:hypothetical protein